MIGLDWKAIAVAESHPLQLEILSRLLALRADASPKDLAGMTGEPLGNVAYHVRQLLAMGLVELTRTAQRRGALEHYYRLSDLALVKEAVA